MPDNEWETLSTEPGIDCVNLVVLLPLLLVRMEEHLYPDRVIRFPQMWEEEEHLYPDRVLRWLQVEEEEEHLYPDLADHSIRLTRVFPPRGVRSIRSPSDRPSEFPPHEAWEMRGVS